MQKNYNIKIYNLAGTYIRTISPSLIMSGVSFSGQINGGMGEMRTEIKANIDSNIVEVGNIVKVYEATDESAVTRVIYTGIVGSLNRVSAEHAEYIEIRCLGLSSMLSWVYYDDAGSYVHSKNQEPALTLKNIIDRFSVKYPGLISYTGSSVENFGAASNLSFDYTKAIEALTKTTETTDFWWHIDREGVLQFHPKTGATGQIHHKLDEGNDIISITVEENSENVVNKYILFYTGGSVTASDATSQSTYGIRELKDSKTEITNATTANAAASAYISKNKDSKRRIEIVVNTNYDIESIRPGDIVTVRNISYNISSLQINKIEYNPDSIKLELEDIFSFSREVFIS